MDVLDRPLRMDTTETLREAAREAGASLIKSLTIPKPFDDAQLEARFLEDHSQRFCAFRRAAALLALVVWSGFVWWDFRLAHRSEAVDLIFPQILMVRALGTALLAFAGGLTLLPSFRTHLVSQRVISLGIYGTLIFMVLLVVITPRPYNYSQYFVGFYISLFFEFSFFYLKSRTTLTAALITLATVIVAQLTSHILDTDDFLAGLVYLVNIIVVGHGVCVHSERVSRDRFLAERAMVSLNNDLLKANDELERRNQDLQSSKKDQEIKTNALLALKEQQAITAEIASREKSNFLAVATHDLRQPMHALNLFLQAGVEAIHRKDFAEATRLMNESGRSSLILARLLNAVLDLSRLESGRVDPRYHVFDLRAVIQEAAEQLRPSATTRGVELRLRLPRDMSVYVRSDAHWLGRAVSNLIANGIKYGNTDENGRPVVLVGVVRSATRARIDVVDNGIGIAPEYWESIFHPFFQIGNPEQDRDKGLGLGLSIVNAVISMLDEHRIELKSAQGKGSRFSIEMPICGFIPDQAAPGASAETAELIREPLEGRYVLLVEDDGLVRASTEALLVQWGVLFDSAASYEEFEDILDSIERFPDLVISDYRLANFKTARHVAMLSVEKLGKNTPILVVTGEPSAPIVPLACHHDLLSKPVSPDDLRRQMASLIAERHLEREET
jgi:two-component system, sensor histidine kinase